MDASSLKKAVESIEMPDAMRQRIIANCKKTRISNMEEKNLNKAKNWFRRPAAVAVVLALCICLPAAGVAAGNSGFFRDIMRGTAVVGIEYEQATDEISVTAEAQSGAVQVTAVFRMPDAIPYSKEELLSLGHYQVLDQAGTVVSEGERSDAAAIVNGCAVITVPVDDLAPGMYTLRIDSFIGEKKADQPLPLKGFWECALTVE